MCRVGRGLSYNSGVSPRGRPHYDHILSLAGDQYAGYVMAALTHYDFKAN